jgi:hypothetical protein
MIKYATLIASAVLLSACASTNSPTAADRADVRNAEVRTGTRLPSRNDTSVKTVSGQDYKQDSTRTIGDAPKGN